MSIKVVLPVLNPGWPGGAQYLSTIRVAARELESRGKIDIVGCPRVLSSIRQTNTRYSINNGVILISDFLRSFRGLNVPRPLSLVSTKSLAWIPDLQDIERPEFFDDMELMRRKRLRERYVRNKAIFFFSSHHALDVFEKLALSGAQIAGVLRFASQLNIQADLESDQILCEGCNRFGYYYLPNQWWLHKNHEWALRAFSKYQHEGGLRHLILTGKEQDSRWPEYSADKIIKKYNLKNVHRLGIVERRFQKRLFQNATAVLQPSLYEGWSTSIEEALSFGSPVIASNIPSNSEQLIKCSDAVLISKNGDDELIKSLFKPPTRLTGESITERNFFRWNRFLNDLESIIVIGNDLSNN